MALDEVQTHLCTLTRPSTILLGDSIRSDLHTPQLAHRAASIQVYSFTTRTNDFPSEDQHDLGAIFSGAFYGITGHDTKDDARE
jgi:hypothetical protein